MSATTCSSQAAFAFTGLTPFIHLLDYVLRNVHFSIIIYRNPCASLKMKNYYLESNLVTSCLINQFISHNLKIYPFMADVACRCNVSVLCSSC